MAQKHPQLLKKLFSYDGSDLVNGYKRLYDSFSSEWAADMALSQEEVLEAARLKELGLSDAQIQEEYDRKFSRYYPFEESKTSALLEYEKTVLYNRENLESDTTYGAGCRIDARQYILK